MAKKKIMIVDDEENLRKLLEAILEEEFDVLSVDSGTNCLKKIGLFKPDLVLMDMFMPGMSGRETTEKIRADKKNNSIKIIFLTVSRFSETGKEMLKKMKVSDYITKPFDNADLVKRVKKALV